MQTHQLKFSWKNRNFVSIVSNGFMNTAILTLVLSYQRAYH